VGGIGFCKYQQASEQRLLEQKQRSKAKEIESFAHSVNAQVPDWKSLPTDAMTADIQELLRGNIVFKASLVDVVILAGRRTAVFDSFDGSQDLRLELEIADGTDISALKRIDTALIEVEVSDVKPPSNEKESLTVRGVLKAARVLAK
jgi:hypothetical protein